MNREEIIAANPILDYCEARGWKLRRAGREWIMLCPLHEERTPSFYVNPEKQIFNCFGCGAAGSIIDLHMGLCGIDEGTAMRELSPAGGNNKPWTKQPQPQAIAKSDPLTDEGKAFKRRSWPAFETPTRAEIAAIAAQRDLSFEGVAIAVKRGLLFCTEWHERRAWVVTDSSRINAQARRIDGEIWKVEDVYETKAWTLPGSVGGWPVGVREAQPFPAIALVEGSADLLAAFHLAWCETSTPETLALGKGADILGNLGVVAMLGANVKIADAVLPLFAGKRVRLFVHNDHAGYSGTRTWAAALKAAGATIDGFSFRGFLQSNGQPVNDFNDFVRLDPDQWESKRSLIESAFDFVPLTTK